MQNLKQCIKAVVITVLLNFTLNCYSESTFSESLISLPVLVDEQLVLNLYTQEDGLLQLQIKLPKGNLLSSQLVSIKEFTSNYLVETLNEIKLNSGTYEITYSLNDRVIGSKKIAID